jgi:hypothetical protein
VGLNFLQWVTPGLPIVGDFSVQSSDKSRLQLVLSNQALQMNEVVNFFVNDCVVFPIERPYNTRVCLESKYRMIKHFVERSHSEVRISFLTSDSACG